MESNDKHVKTPGGDKHGSHTKGGEFLPTFETAKNVKGGGNNDKRGTDHAPKGR